MTVELIKSGLRFAGMIRISDPAVAERYNLCLKKFGLADVAEPPFHVDACGFSLEVANKLRSMDYLNPGGVGRRFIIVSPDQARAPFVDTTFSHTKPMMLAFYAANAATIARLTLRDTIFGQVKDAPVGIDDLDEVLRRKTVTLDVQTINGTSQKAEQLDTLVERFKTDRNLWTDLTYMETMASIAREVGDVRTSAVTFDKTDFTVPDHYSTAMLSGFSLIEGVVMGNADYLAQRNKSQHPIFDAQKAGQVLGHFHGRGLIEPFNPSWLSESGLLQHRLHCLVCELIPDEISENPSNLLDENFAEALLQNHRTRLIQDSRFEVLSLLRKMMTFSPPQEVDQAERSITAKVRLSLRRAQVGHPAATEINRLLCGFADYDPLTLFITDKARFYEEFEKRNTTQQAFWIAVVQGKYLGDKENARRRIFGY